MIRRRATPPRSTVLEAGPAKKICPNLLPSGSEVDPVEGFSSYGLVVPKPAEIERLGAERWSSQDIYARVALSVLRLNVQIFKNKRNSLVITKYIRKRLRFAWSEF